MRRGTVIALAGAFLLAGSAAGFAEQHKEKAAGSEVSCDDIEAAWDEGGGNVSEDMIAKKLNVSIERIRTCLKKEAMEEEKAETPPSSK